MVVRSLRRGETAAPFQKTLGRNFYGRFTFSREIAPRGFTASAPDLLCGIAVAGRILLMWTAPALKSLIKSVSARERHPIDDEFFILAHVQPEGRLVGHLGELTIPSHVMDEDGQHYVFEGIAARPGLVNRQIG
jgi:hypothetical protein